MEIRHTNLLKHLEKMKPNPDRRDRDYSCLYHQDHGHFTQECNLLKDDIQARNGYLREFVEKNDKQKDK